MEKNIEIVKTKEGSYTAKIVYFDESTQSQRTIYTNSKYYPSKEAKEWAESVYEQDKDNFLIYGLGIGYHIKELVLLLNEKQKIYVIDANKKICKELKKYRVIENGDKVEILISEEMEEISKFLGKIQGENKLIFYANFIELIPQHLRCVRNILEAIKVKRTTNETYLEHMRINYEKHEKTTDINVEKLYGKYKGKPIIIVSAGPSLDKNIDYLKMASEECIIFTGGRALKTLLDRNIRVDLFCITDAKPEYTYKQIQGLEDKDIPLVYLNTANYETIAKYHGTKYIAYNMDTPEDRKGRIASGGSVATVMLQLSILFGGNPILFIGQDLAYTDKKSHFSGTETYTLYSEKERYVEGLDGNYVLTTPAMASYKNWIEQKILQYPTIEFYNCTEGGAYINGCKHEPLLDVLKKFDVLGSV